MAKRNSRTASNGLFAAGFVAFGVGVLAPGGAGAQEPSKVLDHNCTSDLSRSGTMADLISNAMVLGLKAPSGDVYAFLQGANKRWAHGDEVLAATVKYFKMDEAVLKAEIERFRHCNCRLGPMPDGTPPPVLAKHKCTVDLAQTGDMKNVVSSVLLWEFKKPDEEVRRVLGEAQQRVANGQELMALAARHFKIDHAAMAVEVERYRHCNCTMGDMIEGLDLTGDGPAAGAAGVEVEIAPMAVSAFAKDVTLHVVLHELGHALIREFDIPVLGNEETAADAFATYYLTTYMPDRALDVIKARVTSLTIEAKESPTDNWKGEHDHDGRRAFQIAAMAIAADAEKYKAVGEIVGMGEGDIRKAKDYGADNRRSWRRVLMPLWMPEGAASSEARVTYDTENPFMKQLCSEGIAREIESAIKRFDWHSQVTVKFSDGEGGAGWSRGTRTITVNSAYVRRFIMQGTRGLGAE